MPVPIGSQIRSQIRSCANRKEKGLGLKLCIRHFSLPIPFMTTVAVYTSNDHVKVNRLYAHSPKSQTVHKTFHFTTRASEYSENSLSGHHHERSASGDCRHYTNLHSLHNCSLHLTSKVSNVPRVVASPNASQVYEAKPVPQYLSGIVKK